jgi:ArsR family transcriptional regulator, lead/cadmium/zinc/bismuth-responsive transcriptional repressor
LNNYSDNRDLKLNIVSVEKISIEQGETSAEVVKSQVLSIDKAQRMAEFFSVLGDPNRWRILSALAVQEMRVRDLADAVEMTESAVSHQLRILRTMRLVRYSKKGRNVVYGLKDDHIFNLYRDVSEHLDESE